MNYIRDARLLERIFVLLQECGMPDTRPSPDLLWEIYWMMEEHFEEASQ